ncbi:MAG TPA: hypothetical protein VFP55_02390 [Solirubrobacteraceae bacterium]|nr:hypothetical protein [Solirubrobacteraceae bacterium]
MGNNRANCGTASAPDRPHPSRGERPPDRGFGAFWSVNRLSLTLGLLVALTFGAIVALRTGYWWILGIAAGVHALGTTGVYLLSWRTMTISEHPSPAVAAAMAEEGILTPDATFSQMVDEFRPEPPPSVAGALAPEGVDRRTPASIDPARAAIEEAAALTATSGRSRAVRFGGPTEFMVWTIAFGIAVASLVIAAVFGGGWLWLAPGIVVLPAIGLMWLMDQRPEAIQPRSWRPLGMVVAGTVVTVGVFCTLIALFIH